MKRVLLDECVPQQLRLMIPGVVAMTASCAGLANVADPIVAQRCIGRFDVVVTADRGFAH